MKPLDYLAEALEHLELAELFDHLDSFLDPHL